MLTDEKILTAKERDALYQWEKAVDGYTKKWKKQSNKAESKEELDKADHRRETFATNLITPEIRTALDKQLTHMLPELARMDGYAELAKQFGNGDTTLTLDELKKTFTSLQYVAMDKDRDGEMEVQSVYRQLNSIVVGRNPKVKM